MPKEDGNAVDGTVEQALPNAMFPGKLDNGHRVLGAGGRVLKARVLLMQAAVPVISPVLGLLGVAAPGRM